MIKIWQYLLLCALLTGIFSCKRKVVCPAFQSSFIFQDNERTKKFSLFDEDTLPKTDALYKKLKYGVKAPASYKSTVKVMSTVDMELLFPLKLPLDSLVYAEMNFVKTDSLYDYADAEVDIFFKSMKKGNVDQMYYNGIFGESLRDISQVIDNGTVKEEGDASEGKKRWGLFKKKNGQKEDKELNKTEIFEEGDEEDGQYLEDFKKEDFW